MTSSGDTWRAVRAPKQSVWVPCKTAGIEFVRGVTRPSRTTLFDTRQHITKGCHLPEPLCSQRYHRSKTTLPNISITSLSKVWDHKLDPLTFTKSLPKNKSGDSFDRMLRGKSLMSTAEYYELKRLYDRRPYTPQNRLPCRLRAMPRARSITETLEQTMYYLQRPLTLLPQRSKHHSSRSKPNITPTYESLLDSEMSLRLPKVQHEVTPLGCPSSAVGRAKTSDILPACIKEPNLPASYFEYRTVPPSSEENRKAYLRSTGLEQIAGMESFQPQTPGNNQFTLPETHERVMLDLPESQSFILRQTGQTSSDVPKFPQLTGTSRFQSQLGSQKPEVPANLKIIGNKPLSLLELSDSSRRLTVTPRATPHGADVVLETHMFAPAKDYDLNVSGKKVENKSNIQIANFLNYTRDYRIGHVVSRGQTCDRMSSHWTANDLQTRSLQKLRNGSPGLLEQILPRTKKQDERSIKSQLHSASSPADLETGQIFDYFVSSGQELWQRDESTVRERSSASPSESRSRQSTSSSASSSLSIRSSASDLLENQSEKNKNTDQGMEGEKRGDTSREVEVSSTTKSNPLLPSRFKTLETSQKIGRQSTKLEYIKACGRISPLPFSSRKLAKAHNGERILTAEGHPVVFASSARTLAALPPYCSPLPFPRILQSSTSKWRLPSFSHNPWGGLIKAPSSREPRIQHTKMVPDKMVKLQDTQKKPDKKHKKIWRRKKRRHKVDKLFRCGHNQIDTSCRTGAISESKLGPIGRSNFLCFTPVYDLRYDQWKRQCNKSKDTHECNLSIRATATPCRKGLKMRSDSEESDDSCDSEEEEECMYASPDRSTDDYQHPSGTEAEREKGGQSVISVHIPEIARPQTNNGPTPSLAPSPPGSRRDGQFLEIKGKACPSSERMDLHPADKAPPTQTEENQAFCEQGQNLLDGDVEEKTVSKEEMIRSGDEVVLSSSELFDLESTGRLCTCSSGGETVECSDTRPDFWSITGILRGRKRPKKKHTTVGEYLDTSRSSSRDSRLSSGSAISSMWVTDSLSVAAIGSPTPTDSLEPQALSKREQRSPRKRAEQDKQEERSSKFLTLQRILGLLPNIGLVQLESSEKCDHELAGRRSGLTPCRSCMCKTAQAQASSHCSTTDRNFQPIQDRPWQSTPSFTLPRTPSNRSSSRSLPTDQY